MMFVLQLIFLKKVFVLSAVVQVLKTCICCFSQSGPASLVDCGASRQQQWQLGPPSVSADKYSQPAIPGMDVGCSETWQCDIILSTLISPRRVRCLGKVSRSCVFIQLTAPAPRLHVSQPAEQLILTCYFVIALQNCRVGSDLHGIQLEHVR